MRMRRFVVAAIVIPFGLASTVLAGPLAYDGFSDYGDQSFDDGLASDGGEGWATAWTRDQGNADAITTSSSASLTYMNGSTLLTGSGSAQDMLTAKAGGVSRNINAASLGNGQHRWFSLLLQVDAGPATSQSGQWMHGGLNSSSGNSSNSGAIDGFSLTNWDVDAGTYNIGAKIGNGINSASTSLLLGTTYFIVGDVYNDADNNLDAVTVYINPVIGGSTPTGWLDTANLTQGSIGTDALQFDLYMAASTDLKPSLYQFDEIRIGDTFADVSPIPEPGSLVLLAICFVLFRGLRGRR